GSALVQDGASNGITAPNGGAQQRTIRRALFASGLTAADIDVVEAHGTGTQLGDSVEAQAIQRTYGARGPVAGPVWLTSVKSNIRHTQAAAGIMSVIKVLLAMRHGVLPRTLHAERPSARIAGLGGELQLLAQPVAWPRT